MKYFTVFKRKELIPVKLTVKAHSTDKHVTWSNNNTVVYYSIPNDPKTVQEITLQLDIHSK